MILARRIAVTLTEIIEAWTKSVNPVAVHMTDEVRELRARGVI